MQQCVGGVRRAPAWVLAEAEVTEWTFPFGGGGYKKPSCSTWAYPDSRVGHTPFTSSFELFWGGMVDTQGQLGDSQGSALLPLTVGETLAVSGSVLVGCREGFSLQGPLAPARREGGVVTIWAGWCPHAVVLGGRVKVKLHLRSPG